MERSPARPSPLVPSAAGLGHQFQALGRHPNCGPWRAPLEIKTQDEYIDSNLVSVMHAWLQTQQVPVSSLSLIELDAERLPLETMQQLAEADAYTHSDPN